MPVGFGPEKKIDVDAADAFATELDIARPGAAVELARRPARRGDSCSHGLLASVVTRRAAGSIALIVAHSRRTPGLGERPVGQPHSVERRAAEHHVELRIAEGERFALVVDRPSTLSRSRSARIVLGSRPPNPAADTRTRAFLFPR